MTPAGPRLEQVQDTLSAELGHYLDDLRTLVSIDSGTFDKAGVDRVVDTLESWYADLGATIQRRRNDVYGDSLVVRLKGSLPGTVLLIGHTDTVYPLGTAGERPMRIVGGHALGPGTADMKAGDLAILYALRAILDQGPGYLGNVIVLHNSDEEIGSPSSKDLVAKLAAESDAVLVLEAGRDNGDIVVARKGIMDVQVWVTGIAAHAGVNHDQGRSAILALAHIVTAVEALSGSAPGLTVNVGRIDGGDRANVVPDRAYARLEVRAFERDVLERAVEQIAHVVASPPIDGIEARMEVSVEHWPMNRAGGTDVLLGMARAVGRELGIDFGWTATGGASDANTVAAAARPVLDGLGPVGGRTHSPYEYIEIPSVVPRTALLAGLIAELGRVGPSLRDRA